MAGFKRIFSSQKGWADLLPRLISGIVLLVCAFFLIRCGGIPYIGFILLISVLVAFEGLSLARGSQERPFTGFKYIAAQLIALLIALIGAVGFFVLRLGERGAENVFFLLFLVVACDTGAYFVGRVIEGRKLAPTISPGKTVSGALGGLFFAVFSAVLLSYVFLGHWIISVVFYAILLGVSSQIGDLCESAAKRRAGVKDSGKVIPGHGGVLDRLDGVLGALPLALFFQFLAGTTPFWSVSIKSLLHIDIGF